MLLTKVALKKILFKARTNTLNLNWRNRFKLNPDETDTTCPMCMENEETLEHFLLRCPINEDTRSKYNFWNVEEMRLMLGKILCFEEGLEGRDMLKELWINRKRFVPQWIDKYKNDNKEDVTPNLPNQPSKPTKCDYMAMTTTPTTETDFDDLEFVKEAGEGHVLSTVPPDSPTRPKYCHSRF